MRRRNPGREIRSSWLRHHRWQCRQERKASAHRQIIPLHTTRSREKSFAVRGNIGRFQPPSDICPRVSQAPTQDKRQDDAMEATAFARVLGHRLHVRSFWNSSTHPKFTFWDPRRGAMARQRKKTLTDIECSWSGQREQKGATS